MLLLSSEQSTTQVGSGTKADCSHRRLDIHVTTSAARDDEVSVLSDSDAFLCYELSPVVVHSSVS